MAAAEVSKQHKQHCITVANGQAIVFRHLLISCTDIVAYCILPNQWPHAQEQSPTVLNINSTLIALGYTPTTDAILALVLQATAAAQINASVLTAGDYTVYVTGLPRDVSNSDLIEYASHYGEVRS